VNFTDETKKRERERETMSSQISEIEQEQLIEKLEIFKIHGRDKRGRKILRIIGKFFPGTDISIGSVSFSLCVDLFLYLSFFCF